MKYAVCVHLEAVSLSLYYYVNAARAILTVHANPRIFESWTRERHNSRAGKRLNQLTILLTWTCLANIWTVFTKFEQITWSTPNLEVESGFQEFFKNCALLSKPTNSPNNLEGCKLYIMQSLHCPSTRWQWRKTASCNRPACGLSAKRIRVRDAITRCTIEVHNRALACKFKQVELL